MMHQQGDAPLRRRLTRPGLTGDFTMHEHCGGFAKELQRCLSEHDLPRDPLAVKDWKVAPACQLLWSRYRECGREFIAACESTRCSQEVDAFNVCDASKKQDCTQLELTALRCLGRKIRLRMTQSGKSVHDIFGQNKPS